MTTTTARLLVVGADVTPDGAGAACVSVGPDQAFGLDAMGARDYAAACVARAAEAEHDAAIVEALVAEMGLTEAAVSELVRGRLHPAREVDHQATHPIVFRADVGRQRDNGRARYVPFVTVSIGPEVLGRMTTEEVRAHAVDILDATRMGRLCHELAATLRDERLFSDAVVRQLGARLAHRGFGGGP